MPTHRGYIFVINNPLNTDWIAVERLSKLTCTLRLICQLEYGESGTPHIQGYVEFKNAQRMSRLNLARAHIEQRVKAPLKAWNYCIKPNELPEGIQAHVISVGEKPPESQGSRTDVLQIYKMLKEKKPLLEIVDLYPGTYMRMHRGIKDIRNMLSSNRENKIPVVEVYWGPTGTGKSHKLQSYDNGEAYWLDQGTNSNTWFTNYTNEKVILIDDFYGWIKYSFLLRLLDRYPVSLPIHGGQIKCNANTFIFTSNKPPMEWYPNIDTSALERRFTKVENMTEVYEE